MFEFLGRANRRVDHRNRVLALGFDNIKRNRPITVDQGHAFDLLFTVNHPGHLREENRLALSARHNQSFKILRLSDASGDLHHPIAIARLNWTGRKVLVFKPERVEDLVNRDPQSLHADRVEFDGDFAPHAAHDGHPPDAADILQAPFDQLIGKRGEFASGQAVAFERKRHNRVFIRVKAGDQGFFHPGTKARFDQRNFFPNFLGGLDRIDI